MDGEKEKVEREIADILRSLEAAVTRKVMLQIAPASSSAASVEKETPSKSRHFKSPDAIEHVLREKGSFMHASDITEAVRQLTGFEEISQQEITSTLVRHNAKEKRFKRVGKNIYDLKERVKVENR